MTTSTITKDEDTVTGMSRQPVPSRADAPEKP